MSARELAALLDLLKSAARNPAAPPAEVRATFDEVLSKLPVAPDLEASREEVGGVPGVWVRPGGAERPRTLMYLHGGGFVAGNAWGYRSLVGELARAAGAQAFAVEYRLAPEWAFPTAVEDSVAAYRGLLDRGLEPASISFGGDSAGGGLVFSTLVAAREAGLPLPGSALAISPWADLEATGGSLETKAAEDLVVAREGLLTMAGAYLGPVDPRDPRASPIHADLTGLPPIMIQVGSAEALLDDAVRLAARAGAAGVATRLEIWPQMIHGWHMFGFMLEEGRDAVRVAGSFIANGFGRDMTRA